MRKFSRILYICILLFLPLAAAAEELVPVGKLIGLQLVDDTVTVAAYDDAFGAAAREGGIKIGDQLVSINGKPVTRARDVTDALEAGQPARITLRRSGRERTVTIQPAQPRDGPRLGILLRQGIAGVGTVTWYDPEEGTFGALGHGVAGSRGALLQMTEGAAFDAAIRTIARGKPGSPGQLKGVADANDLWGILTRNTPQGVFGRAQVPVTGTAIPTAAYEDITVGPAVIRSTVTDRGPQDYSVEILKIYPQSRGDGRNLLLKVTAPALLDITGGIVQGMSGSPIIQDGKLVGAVTHVLVNDPTTGYGIFIENMLDAAG